MRSYDPEGLTQLSLRCCDIPGSLLRVIARWPCLHRLTLQLGLESIPAVPVQCVPQPFGALVDLHISCKDLGLVKSFLCACRIVREHSDGKINSLIRRCRELLQVSICVDARLDSLGATPPTHCDTVGLPPNTHLVKLEVGESPIGCLESSESPMAPDLVMSIPRFVHEMAPLLRRITERPPGAWYRERALHPWENVSYVLEVMVTGDI
jgi:hypothetical protein